MSGSRARRYSVVAAVFVLSLITYMDRTAISSARMGIASDLALSNESMGLVFSAFALGYALTQIPAGWFADRFGPRLALGLVVIVWSVLTSLTGAVTRLGTLLAARFLFGMAEAGAFPGSARAFYNWLPAKERGIAHGILFSGALLGGAIAFPVCNWLIEAYGWRPMFYLLGIPGIVWAAAWLIWFRDHPRTPLVADASEPAPPALSFGQVFRSAPMARAMVQYFAQNFTFFLCISWMHPYLMDRYGLTAAEASRYAMLPLIMGSSANWISGFLVDYMYRAGHRAWSRRLPAILGFVIGSVAILQLAFLDSAAAAAVSFAIATFGVELSVSPSWAYCLDIGGKNSGAVSASMNMVGNFGGFASANAFPFLHRMTGTYATYFVVAALLNLLAIVCWLQMRPPGKTGPVTTPGDFLPHTRG